MAAAAAAQAAPSLDFPPDAVSKKHLLRARVAPPAVVPAENEIRVAHGRPAADYAAYGFVCLQHKGFRVVVCKGTGHTVEKAVEVACALRADMYVLLRGVWGFWRVVVPCSTRLSSRFMGTTRRYAVQPCLLRGGLPSLSI